MKNALLKYATNEKINIFNIGDYIQSLAASQFFDNKVDILLNREYLNEYDGEDVKLIMNGWFMHHPENWPPSSKIHPLFVAFHINSSAAKKLLSPTSISYFKKHEPIGCRDWNSVRLLEQNGVAAYFSGCLTLTLGLSYQNQHNESKIYFTDPFCSVNKNLLQLISTLTIGFKSVKTVQKLCKRQRLKFSLRNFVRTAYFYRVYSQMFTDDVLLSAHYINQEIEDNFGTENEKFDYARKLLKMYSQAKYVVTSRIHCALPCLAMNTPVLFIDNVKQPEISSCRLEGLKELFHVIEYDNGNLSCESLKSKFSKTSDFKNKSTFLSLKEKLIATCNSFIGS